MFQVTPRCFFTLFEGRPHILRALFRLAVVVVVLEL